MISITHKIALKVGQRILVEELKDQTSEYDHKYICGHSIEEVTQELLRNKSEVIFRVSKIIGQIEQFWGYSIDLVFHHMGVDTVEETEEKLYRLIMNTMGHGISIQDSLEDDEALSKAESILCNSNEDRFHNVPYLDSHCALLEVIYDYVVVEPN